MRPAARRKAAPEWPGAQFLRRPAARRANRARPLRCNRRTPPRSAAVRAGSCRCRRPAGAAAPPHRRRRTPRPRTLPAPAPRYRPAAAVRKPPAVRPEKTAFRVAEGDGQLRPDCESGVGLARIAVDPGGEIQRRDRAAGTVGRLDPVSEPGAQFAGKSCAEQSVDNQVVPAEIPPVRPSQTRTSMFSGRSRAASAASPRSSFSGPVA